MYPDFEYRGYCRKFKTGLILLEKETMNLFDIDIYSYHMSDREEFVASALLSNLKHLDPEDARKQIESVIRRREDGDFEIEGKALTSLIDQTVQSDYKELIDRTSEEYSAFAAVVRGVMRKADGKKIVEHMSYAFATFLKDCYTALQ